MRSRIAGWWLGCVIVGSMAWGQTAIEGSLVDGTHGGPGQAERVMLLQLAGGMSQVAALTDVSGSFHFDLADTGPYLVQVLHQGATYTARVAAQDGVAKVALTLYDSTSDDSSLRVKIPHYILIVDGPKLHVSRGFEIENPTQPPMTIVGQPGAFRFSMPDDATVTSASVTTTAMPLRQEPVDTADDRGSTIAYPLKPGLTHYAVEYEVPYSGSIDLRETLFQGATALQVIVAPAEVDVSIEGLDALGREEREGVTLLRFQGTNLPRMTELKIQIRGQALAPLAPGQPGGGAAEAIQGEIKEVPSPTGRGVTRLLLLLIPTLFLVLTVAIGLSRGRPAAVASSPRESGRARELFAAIASLDQRLGAGTLDAAEHALRRADLKREVLTELSSGRRKKKRA